MARYLIKFEKGKGVKFISHLDLMRVVQRAIRRAGIPISYSKGFNPHAEFSIASPLPVGTWSVGEYMDMGLDREMDEVDILKSLDDALPPDINLEWVKRLEDKFPSLMSIVAGARYEVTLAVDRKKEITQSAVDEFMGLENIEVVKHGKRGSRNVNIRPMIRDLRLKSVDGDSAVFNLTVDAGSKSNLGPELLVEAMGIYIEPLKEAQIRDIKKEETYVSKDGRLQSPDELTESDYA